MNTNRTIAVPSGQPGMSADRKAAVWIGSLYIIGTVALVLSLVVTDAVLTGPTYLAQVAAQPNQLTIGALLVLLAGFALALVPVVFWPVGKRYNETLAMGYVVFRGAIETVIYIVGALGWLLLIPLSTQPDAAPLAGSVRSAETVIWEQLGVFPFVLGALMFYVLLYQSRLVPRWLSTWGLVGAALYIVAPLGSMFGLLARLLHGSARPAGDGHGGLADREGLQPTFDRCRVSRKDVSAAGRCFGVSSVERPDDGEGQRHPALTLLADPGIDGCLRPSGRKSTGDSGVMHEGDRQSRVRPTRCSRARRRRYAGHKGR